VALDDPAGVREFVARNRNDRQEFFNDANGRMPKPIDSQANFVMVNVEHPATELIEHFRKHNILTGRHFPCLWTPTFASRLVLRRKCASSGKPGICCPGQKCSCTTGWDDGAPARSQCFIQREIPKSRSLPPRAYFGNRQLE
jgi:hypothetical protein